MTSSLSTFKFACSCDVSKNIGTCRIDAIPEYQSMTHTELIIHAKEQQMVQGVTEVHLDFALAQIERRDRFRSMLEKSHKFNCGVLQDLRNRVCELELELKQHSSQLKPTTEFTSFAFSADDKKKLHQEIASLKRERADLEGKIGELRELVDHQQKHGPALSDADFERVAVWLEQRQVMEQSILDKVIAQKDDTLEKYQQLYPQVMIEYQEQIAQLKSEVDALSADNQELQSRTTAEASRQDIETRQQLQQLQQLTSERDQAKRQFTLRAEKITTLDTEVESLKKQLQDKEVENRTLQAQIRGHDQAMASQKADLMNKYQRQCEEAINECKRRHSETINSLKAEHQTVAAMETEKKRLRSQLDKAEKEMTKVHEAHEQTCSGDACAWKLYSQIPQDVMRRIMFQYPNEVEKYKWVWIWDILREFCVHKMGQNTPTSEKVVTQESPHAIVQTPRQLQMNYTSMAGSPAIHAPQLTMGAVSGSFQQSVPSAARQQRRSVSSDTPQETSINGQSLGPQRAVRLNSNDGRVGSFQEYSHQSPTYLSPGSEVVSYMHTFPPARNTSIAPPSTPIAANSRGATPVSYPASTHGGAQRQTTARKAPSGMGHQLPHTPQGYPAGNGTASMATDPRTSRLGASRNLQSPNGYEFHPDQVLGSQSYSMFSHQPSVSTAASQPASPAHDLLALNDNERVLMNMIPPGHMNLGRQLQDSINASTPPRLNGFRQGTKRPASAMSPSNYHQPAAQKPRR